jgi:hypothetical protein
MEDLLQACHSLALFVLLRTCRPRISICIEPVDLKLASLGVGARGGRAWLVRCHGLPEWNRLRRRARWRGTTATASKPARRDENRSILHHRQAQALEILGAIPLTLLAAFTASVHYPSDGVRRLQCASRMASRCGQDRPTRLDLALRRGSPRRCAAPRPSPLMAPGSLRRWTRARPPYTTAARSQSSGSSSSRCGEGSTTNGRTARA